MNVSNLPVKYTLFPIFDYDKIISGKKADYVVKNIRIVGYAVTKCYVKERRTIYTGSCENEKDLYKVIYPFKEYYLNGKDGLQSKTEEDEGEYVPVVFDEYEEAKSFRELENKKILLDEMKKPVKKRKFSEDYVVRLHAGIEKIEHAMLLNTSSVDITKNKCKLFKNEMK